MRTLVKNATIVNEGRSQKGSIVIENDRIACIQEHQDDGGAYDETVDASGCFVMPGVIDTHVHFREPGLTRKADMACESRAAAYGGVTSYFDMPNTVPQTTTLEALDEKFCLAREKSHVNYSFFFGATNNNTHLFPLLDVHRIPGIKLFMGSSTGNMLVDRPETLQRIFRETPLPIMAHCEDTGIINDNMAKAKEAYGDDPPVGLHPLIRSEEACYASTSLAVDLARTYGTRLHVAHVSTARELALFPSSPVLSPLSPFPRVTAEAVIAHLLFANLDYQEKGALVKCNPAIKTPADREALRSALADGRITTIGTDHAPHQLSEKQGGAAKAASGMPMVQFSLPAMLGLVDEGVLSMERMVELMCHNPARLFEVADRGFLREGYKADLVIVEPVEPWTVTEEIIQSKCKWSPVLGHRYRWQVRDVFCNGRHLLSPLGFDTACRGEAIQFRKP